MAGKYYILSGKKGKPVKDGEKSAKRKENVFGKKFFKRKVSRDLRRDSMDITYSGRRFLYLYVFYVTAL